MFRRFEEDVRMVFEREQAAGSMLEVILCYPALHTLRLLRIAHVLSSKRGWPS